jgi:tetratricopeptide (TPR) repeat protein
LKLPLIKKEYDDAIADLDIALSIDPTYNDAHHWRAASLYYNRAYNAAVVDFTEAIRLKPDDTPSYNFRAVTYSKLCEHELAVADLTRACELDSCDIYAHTQLAWILAACHHKEVRDGRKAVEYATIAWELIEWKDWECLGPLAFANAKARDIEAGNAVVERMLALDDTEVTATNGSDESRTAARSKLLCCIYSQMKLFDHLLSEMERATKLDGDNHFSHYDLAPVRQQKLNFEISQVFPAGI